MKPFKVKTYSKFFAASFHEKMPSGSSFTPDVTGTFVWEWNWFKTMGSGFFMDCH